MLQNLARAAKGEVSDVNFNHGLTMIENTLATACEKKIMIFHRIIFVCFVFCFCGLSLFVFVFFYTFCLYCSVLLAFSHSLILVWWHYPQLATCSVPLCMILPLDHWILLAFRGKKGSAPFSLFFIPRPMQAQHSTSILIYILTLTSGQTLGLRDGINFRQAAR